MQNTTSGKRDPMEQIDVLLTVLGQLKGDKNTQAIVLQSYISNFGPIPDEYGDKVKALLYTEEGEKAEVTELK